MQQVVEEMMPENFMPGRDDGDAPVVLAPLGDETGADPIRQAREKLAGLRDIPRHPTGQPVAEKAKRGETEERREEREEANKENFLEWVELNSQEKTQLVADRMGWTGEGRYRCWLQGAKEQPIVEIQANSEEEAKARYLQLCGIRSVDNEKYTPRAVPAGQAPAGRKRRKAA